MTLLRAMVPSVPLDWAEVTLARRPVPRDGLPVIGMARPGLSVAVLHSGITLGALVAEMLARDILTGATPTPDPVSPYRPDRFSA